MDLLAALDEVESLVFDGSPAAAWEPLEQCVAQYDAAPSAERERRLLTVMGSLLLQFDEYPELELARSTALLDDLDRRHRAGGHGRRAVQHLRWLFARHLGDPVGAEAAFRAWSAAPRDAFSFCAGCELTSMVQHLVDTERADLAIALALSGLENAQIRCSEQPQAVFTALLPAYVAEGDLAVAADAHLLAYRRLRDDPDERIRHAEHIRFCALTGNVGRARDLVDRHLDEESTPYAELRFAVAASLATGDEDFAEQALDLAAAFDERNGTTHQGELTRRDLAEPPWLDSLWLFGPPGRLVGTAEVLTPPAAGGTATPERPDPDELGGAGSAFVGFDFDDPEAAGELARRWIDLAHAAHREGRDHAAVEAGEQALTYLHDPRVRRLADPGRLRTLRNVLAAAYSAVGEHESALHQLDLVLRDEAAGAEPGRLGMILQKKGELLERLNSDTAAVKAHVEAAAQYGLAGQRPEQVTALRLAAQSARYAQALDTAETLLTEAAAVAATLPPGDPRTPAKAAVVHWEQALLEDAQGDPESAVRSAATAARLYEAAGLADNARSARLYVLDRAAAPTAEITAFFETLPPHTPLWYRTGRLLLRRLEAEDRHRELIKLQHRLDAE